MNTDYRQSSSWKGGVNNVPKLQAQHTFYNLVLLYICGESIDLKLMSSSTRSMTSSMQQMIPFKQNFSILLRILNTLTLR